eukprot:2584377-Amphidinium_carterae.1
MRNASIPMQRNWKGTSMTFKLYRNNLITRFHPPRRTATAPHTPRAAVDTLESRGVQRGTHHEEISSQVAETISRCEAAVRTNLERTP